jgi:hypothetical protein
MSLNLIKLPRAVYQHLKGGTLDGDARSVLLTAGMTLIFIVVIAPAAVLRRLTSRRPGFGKTAGWIEINESTTDIEKYQNLL